MLTAPCRLTVSASGAQALAPTCPRYIDAERGFTLSWKTGKVKGEVTLGISVAYPGTETQVVSVPVVLR